MNKTTLTRADFSTDQEVRWCPGCGDYAILKSVQKVLPTLGIPKENFVFVSGIGCASRFPYYLNTYGFHTIHGRAPTIASGLKLARPELSVWVITGDGDGLSIGANHLLHLFRRNIDLKVLLFNNQIYGLTKGQYSPTSEQHKITKSSPGGSLERPIDGIKLALSANATFIARALDVDQSGLVQVLTAAAKHRGTAFVEILQNCNVFNDGAFRYLTDKSQRPQTMLWLEHDKPLRYGKDKERGVRWRQSASATSWQPKLETFEINAETADTECIRHNIQRPDPALLHALSDCRYPDYPLPMGIFQALDNVPSYDELLQQQQLEAAEKHPDANLETLFHRGTTWHRD